MYQLFVRSPSFEGDVDFYFTRLLLSCLPSVERFTHTAGKCPRISISLGTRRILLRSPCQCSIYSQYLLVDLFSDLHWQLGPPSQLFRVRAGLSLLLSQLRSPPERIGKVLRL